jgi:hypothetical protein
VSSPSIAPPEVAANPSRVRQLRVHPADSIACDTKWYSRHQVLDWNNPETLGCDTMPKYLRRQRQLHGGKHPYCPPSRDNGWGVERHEFVA